MLLGPQIYVHTCLSLSIVLACMSVCMYVFCSKTLDHLMEESGCALEHPNAAKFRSYVIAGEWDQVSWKWRVCVCVYVERGREGERGRERERERGRERETCICNANFQWCTTNCAMMTLNLLLVCIPESMEYSTYCSCTLCECIQYTCTCHVFMINEGAYATY